MDTIVVFTPAPGPSAGPVDSDYYPPSNTVPTMIWDFHNEYYRVDETGSGLSTKTTGFISGFSALETAQGDGIQRLRTENGDQPLILTSAFDWSATAGTVLVRGRFDALQSFCRFWEVHDTNNAATERIVIYLSSSPSFLIRLMVEDNDVVQAEISDDAYTSDTDVGVAVSWSANDFRISVNGGTTLTDTAGTVPTNLTDFRFGHSQATDAPGGGIQELRYWNTQLSATDLEAISSIA